MQRIYRPILTINSTAARTAIPTSRTTLFRSYHQETTSDETMKVFLNTIHSHFTNKDYHASKELITKYTTTIEDAPVLNMSQILYVAGWKLLLLRYNAMLHFNMNELEVVVDCCDQILAMEHGINQMRMEDHGFFALNFACSLKARVLMERKQFEEALRYQSILIDERLRKYSNVTIEVVTDLYLELTRRANAYCQLKKYRDAISDLNEAIQCAVAVNIAPDSLCTIYISRSNIYQAMKDYTTALADVEEALKLKASPSLISQAQVCKINCLMSSGKYTQCIKYCDTLLGQHKEQSHTFISKAKCYMSLGDYKSAYNNCQHAIRVGVYGNASSEVNQIIKQCMIHMAHMHAYFTPHKFTNLPSNRSRHLIIVDSI
jgi:tetratricopeptide (TPR) repeat protein